MYRYCFAIALHLIALVVGVPRGFAESDSQQIFVVDVQKVLDESVAGKAAKRNLETEVKKTKSRLDLVKAEIDRETGTLAKQNALMSDDALKQKQDALMTRKREFNLLLRDEDEKVRKRNMEEIQRLVQWIQKVVGRISREKGIEMVLEKDEELVLFASDRIDITDQVLTTINDEEVNS